MNSIVGIKEKNLAFIKEFAAHSYWMPESAHFFSEDFCLELPFAPPGWLQNMSVPETKTHFSWLARTIKSWNWSNEAIYATNLPDTFWILRDGAGDVFWAAHDGHFESRFLTRITVKNDRIVYMRDHFDVCHIYDAISVKLPTFHYDAPAPETLPVPEPVPVLSGESLKQNSVAAVKSMVCVDFWEEGCGSIYADNFVHGLPFTPADMPRYFNRLAYDALNLWLQENTKTWDVYSGTILYETDHPGEYIIESGGGGITTWSGIQQGFYQNRHVSHLRVENGYAVQFDEFFDATKKFNSINISFPSFPYLY